jgi:hypothetical protein
MKKLTVFLSLIFTLLFLSPGFTVYVYADDTAVMEKTLVLTKDDLTNAGATNLILLFEIGGATVNIVQSTDENIICQAVVRYSVDSLEPTLTKKTTDGTYTATFESGKIIGSQPPDITHEWEITIGKYDTDTDLFFALGGVVADVDLGGMPLTNLAFDLGGVSMSIDFSTPTTRTVENVIGGGGGVYLAMMNIGNTNFQKFGLTGGGCAFDLDFHGAFQTGKHYVGIVLSAFDLQATVPAGAGEQVKVYSMVAPLLVIGEGWETVVHRPTYKEYITEDYGTQDVQLNFNITAIASNVVIDRN